MDFLEVVHARYSVRRYQPKPVEQEKVDAIIEAGRLAPSACNQHPTRIMVATSAKNLEKLARCAPPFAKEGRLFGAPLAILVCAKVDESWVRLYDGKVSSDIDSAIVCDQMMMCAVDLGLGTCWICHFDPEIARHEFKLPKNVEPVHILTIGYSAGKPRSADKAQARRIPLSQFLDIRA